MKKVNLFAVITASAFILVNASIWEGTAAVEENLPENGPYLATNSFPVNTLVEVVNLETNKSATLIVYRSLENSRLLALLSKDAADSIGFSSTGRIRMQEKDDQAAYSGAGERRLFPGNYISANLNNGTGGEYISDLEGYDLALVPAEKRPPKDSQMLDPGHFIPSIPATAIPPSTAAASTTVRFSAPMIQNFERGSYYVQIGAYRAAKTVESEILKVGKNLPVAVMSIDSEKGPIYRVLIGPLNLGEGGAVLQHFKTIYKDAFLRVGN
jgi:hypothetical protein